MSFLNSIVNNSKKFEDPFTHWELNKPLNDLTIQEIANADIADPTKHNLQYDGTRAIDGGEGKFRAGISSGGEALKFRCFITHDNSKQFPNLTSFINELQSKKTYEKISDLINKDLSNSYVRVEVICDRKGFWLKPHCDIKEKLVSCLLFVNQFNEDENLGTDFYDKDLNKILKDKDKGTSYLAIEAAKDLLAKSNTNPEDIDMVIMATATPDMPVAATGVYVATQIGAVNAFSFDLVAACSSFLYGISTAAKYIESGRYKKVLLLGADKMSSIIDYEDRATCIIFGDGGGAVLFEPNTVIGKANRILLPFVKKILVSNQKTIPHRYLIYNFYLKSH